MSEQAPSVFLPRGAREIVSAEKVQAGLDHLAQQLQPLVSQSGCLLLGIMTGGLYPLMQLTGRLQGDFLLDYCHATRYLNNQAGEELHWLRRPPEIIAGKTVVVVDDIFDAGQTLTGVVEACKAGGAKEVFSAVLVVKQIERAADIGPPDFTAGIKVPDCYVFGCGMDYAGHWRHLSAIYTLEKARM